jgi:hypothetical protein
MLTDFHGRYTQLSLGNAEYKGGGVVRITQEIGHREGSPVIFVIVLFTTLLLESQTSLQTD